MTRTGGRSARKWHREKLQGKWHQVLFFKKIAHVSLVPLKRKSATFGPTFLPVPGWCLVSEPFASPKLPSPEGWGLAYGRCKMGSSLVQSTRCNSSQWSFYQVVANKVAKIIVTNVQNTNCLVLNYASVNVC
eukprot:Pompholyxophrys_punicea_v1_NODE_72_length_3753_cov_12.732558.p2 type:complete len:132 gc:universal NODE_72_length_3753_cov_12.732558:3091-2696(-)